MISQNSEMYTNFTGILSTPASFVPSLSDTDKYKIIVESIRAYVDDEMEFATFVDLIKKLKFFSGLDNQTNHTNDALLKLVHLSSFVHDEQVRKTDIITTLVAVLDDLSNKQ